MDRLPIFLFCLLFLPVQSALVKYLLICSQTQLSRVCVCVCVCLLVCARVFKCARKRDMSDSETQSN